MQLQFLDGKHRRNTTLERPRCKFHIGSDGNANYLYLKTTGFIVSFSWMKSLVISLSPFR
jgi:hypothetical protein